MKSDPSSRASGKTGAQPRLVVIDGANALYRAFFAIPNLRAPDGTPTNAAYGFATMLAKVLREERPTHVVVAMDPPGGSFRNELYPAYKAGRDKQPEDLSAQIPLMGLLCEAFRVPVVAIPGFEADDVIATLVASAPAGAEVCIVSTDKDLMQLVRPGVELLDTMKGRRIDEAAVEERFGVPPERLLDLRALVGDPSDNIPGVKGIGEKGAAKLILEFGDLDRLLAEAGSVTAKRARESLIEQADAARLSRELSRLREDAPIPAAWTGFDRTEPDRPRLRELYRRLGFTRLLDSLGADPPEAGTAEGTAAEAAAPTDEPTESASSGVSAPTSSPTHPTPSHDPSEGVPALELLREDAALDALRTRLAGASTLVLHPYVTPGTPASQRLRGLALAADDGPVAYAAIAGEGLLDRAGVSLAAVGGLVLDLLHSMSTPRWIAFDSKTVQSVFAEAGHPLPEPAEDLQIAGHLLDSSGAQTLKALVQEHLSLTVDGWEDLAGRGARARSPEDLGVEAIAAWATAEARVLPALATTLRAKIARDELTAVYDEIERPLTAVLSKMERAGVRIDERHLAKLSEEYARELDRTEREIHALAGEDFLVSSPKQLQTILFEKLKLPIVKKTKTGYSTDESVLEQLAAHHELPAKILAWRKLSKLKSTYIDALPPLVDPRTGRIHPSFHQLGAATGRLSASNPNVQNIPIRGAEGARIREAFIPAEGRILISADYSQVELRILAHCSGDPSLVESFVRGDDIHRRTAAEVAGIPLDQVSDDQRARAKAVNFGIIYGSSAFGLAQQLGIAAGEAQATIDAYFARYEGVRRFLDETTERARAEGFVRTLFGRRRYLPDLNSRNRALRQGAERMAVNSVIQGTAADLIKKAMVSVERAIEQAGVAATMILQVHDELVFEAAPEAQETVAALVREHMEGAARLAVPLVVDLGHGRSWREAH
ncbi:MAG: DNA polymerase I [Deltaproteobacteria bacterium]|nr:DNA polymerase I [Deltaproteobacteria bacterium]